MAPHSSTLAWKIPGTEEPGGLRSMGSPRVGHDWATSLSLFAFMHWRRKWQPTPVFLPGESQGRGSLGGSVYGVTQSRTRLRWLSSSSSSSRIRTRKPLQSLGTSTTLELFTYYLHLICTNSFGRFANVWWLLVLRDINNWAHCSAQ